MNTSTRFASRMIAGALGALLMLPAAAAAAAIPAPLAEAAARVTTELAAKHGEAVRPRLERGVRQAASLWRPADGDGAAFEAFVRDNFAADQAGIDALFGRLEEAFEQIDGHVLEIDRALQRRSDLDTGPLLPIDEMLAAYDPGAHLGEDFFANKVAFVALLNFPLTTLEERLRDGERWTRRQWAEARLLQRVRMPFGRRVPAEANQAIAAADAAAHSYIAQYNIWMHHLVDEKGSRLFPPKLRLITHWNLRDELKASYSEPQGGLAKQRTIAKVMERIVTQTIPAAVIDNPHLDWNPFDNVVTAAAARDTDAPPPADLKISSEREPDTRYAMFLGTFHAARQADPHAPAAPTLIARRFDEDREIPEPRMRAMLEEVLSSPLVPKVAKLIEKRLGRPLEPFDIWYNGFKQRGAYTEAELDAIVRKRYPNAEAFAADIPRILRELGFTAARADYLAAKIVVDPSRGAGHAMAAERRGDQAHLRTRIEKDGMNYKGYNIAVHELGHNVEQTFSLYDIDSVLLAGVPNTAFTEALAFVFQGHDLELLGLAKPDERSRALTTLHDFWATYEIAGVALVDMGVWHWMYAHPEATPAELREATLGIARQVWNRYFAPVFGKRDVPLLAIYSHMISNSLYLPDYPLGHLIAHQVEEKMEHAGAIGPEFERITRQGKLSPDLWMKGATGAPVGARALITAAERALPVAQRGSTPPR